jgi:nucleotide-binding universal stress UspA family protein
MTIVCGTDFSPLARTAVRAAGLLARKAKQPLVLLHVLPESAPGLEEADRQTTERAMADLRRIGAELGVGAEATPRIERGSAALTVPEVATNLGAELIVVAATGRGPTRWIFGSTADRIASASPIPLLAIREGFPAEEWTSGARALEIAVATDLSAISDQAIRWAANLSRYGPCRFTLAHVSWPPEAYHRIGIEGPLAIDRTHPAVEAIIARELEIAKTAFEGFGPCEIVVAPPSKKSADALVRLATERKTDLLVVGHQPSRAWRTWEGSVARAVIRAAPVTVACVPAIDAARIQLVPRAETFLAATDLSAAGNAAVAWAAAMVPPDGRVTIVHVVEEPEIDAKRRQEIVDGLRPMGVSQRLIECRVDVRFELVEGEAPASAIGRVAKREGADVICIASQGRSRLPRILLGSVAQELLLTSRIPVLVVPPPRAG